MRNENKSRGNRIRAVILAIALSVSSLGSSYALSTDGESVLAAQESSTNITIDNTVEKETYQSLPIFEDHLEVIKNIVKVVDGNIPLTDIPTIIIPEEDSITKEDLIEVKEEEIIITDKFEIPTEEEVLSGFIYDEDIMPLTKEAYEEAHRINTTDIASPSNLTAEQFDTLIHNILSSKGKSNSKLRGLGTALYDMEQKYGVNGLFALAVGSLESSWGTSNVCNSKNNLFGIVVNSGYRSFSSTYDCVDYFGDFISRLYINKGLTTIDSIAPKYCTTPTWNVHVRAILSDYQNGVEYIN